MSSTGLAQAGTGIGGALVPEYTGYQIMFLKSQSD
jgi:hypothetical protein